jgi:hypothetical protein
MQIKRCAEMSLLLAKSSAAFITTSLTPQDLQENLHGQYVCRKRLRRSSTVSWFMTVRVKSERRAQVLPAASQARRQAGGPQDLRVLKGAGSVLSPLRFRALG